MSRQYIIEELAQSLECPVCFEFPKKPIFTCIVGHHVCYRCHDMLNSCPLCRSEFRGTRSFFAEASLSAINKLLRDSLPPAGDFNLTERPRAISTPGYFMKSKQVENPIRCCLAVNGCRNRLLEASTYIDHLKGKHGALVVSSTSGMYSHKVAVSPMAKTFIKRGVDRLFILELAQTSFVINMFQDGAEVQIWAQANLELTDTSVFKVHLTIPTLFQNAVSWTGNINSHNVTAKSVRMTETCLKTTSHQLKNCVKQDVTGNRYWTLNVHIYTSLRERLMSHVSRTFRDGYDKSRRAVAVLTIVLFIYSFSYFYTELYFQ